MANSGQTIADRLQAAIHTVDGSEMAKIVCKASTHELGAPKKKHLDKLQEMTRQQNVNQPELLNHIILRTREKSWIVVMKALITCHNLMIHGGDKLTQCAASRPVLFSLEHFSDATTPKGMEMSPYIRKYARYLNDKAQAYRSIAFDFCKLKRGKDSVWTKMSYDKLNKSLPTLQEVADSHLSWDTKATDLNNSVINSAFALMHKDLIKLYGSYTDAMIIIISKFYEMSQSQCKTALVIYKKYLKHVDAFEKFFKVSSQVGLDKGDLPDLTGAPKKLLPAFEEHVRSGTGSGDNSNASSPTKSNSVVTSPVNLAKTGLTLEEQAIQEEAAALARFQSNNNKQPQVNNPSQITLAGPTIQSNAAQRQDSYSNDLLSLGNEIGFGSNVVQQASQNQFNQPQNVQPQQSQLFDPFSFQSTPQVQNQIGLQQPSSNNPFNLLGSTTTPPATNTLNGFNSSTSNPFGNPFSGNNLPTQQNPPQNNFVSMNNNNKDPFADLLQPTSAAAPQTNNFSSNDMFNLTGMSSAHNAHTTTNNQSPAFGNTGNVDDALNSMMSNFTVNSQQTMSNSNNPFAF